MGKNKKYGTKKKEIKVKKIKTEISTESENQNVKNGNGKVKKKKTEISTEKLKLSHVTDSTVYRQRVLNH